MIIINKQNDNYINIIVIIKIFIILNILWLIETEKY